ncbi:MAG: 4Fe-4S cluster-binding domain-containing protein, partial [Clostridia bacterium]|nr:4Fe-4S cluster-binding domain-containing protein [Clostridia bacterium]
MKLKGLQKTTLLDFPGYVACTVFTGGCNFRCPFCHNASLAIRHTELPEISEEDFFAFLSKGKGILD